MDIIKIVRVNHINKTPKVYMTTLFVSIPVGIMVSTAVGVYIGAFLNSIKHGFRFDGIIPSETQIQLKYTNVNGLFCRCFLDGKNTHFGNRLIVYTSDESIMDDFLESIKQKVERDEQYANETIFE